MAKRESWKLEDIAGVMGHRLVLKPFVTKKQKSKKKKDEKSEKKAEGKEEEDENRYHK